MCRLVPSVFVFLCLCVCVSLFQVALTCSMPPTVPPKRISPSLTACALPPLSSLVLTHVFVSVHTESVLFPPFTVCNITPVPLCLWNPFRFLMISRAKLVHFSEQQMLGYDTGSGEDSCEQFGTGLGVCVLTGCGTATPGSRNINLASHRNSKPPSSLQALRKPIKRGW